MTVFHETSAAAGLRGRAGHRVQSAPERTRTSDPRLRRPPLCPAELRARNPAVGAPGFEPGTSCSQSRRATKLRHAPLGAENFSDKEGDGQAKAGQVMSHGLCRAMGFKNRI